MEEMDMDPGLAVYRVTQRLLMEQRYAAFIAQGRSVFFNTESYYSTRTFTASITVDLMGTNDGLDGQFEFTPQDLDFFSYGQGDQYPDPLSSTGGTIPWPATYTETNIITKNRTVSEDFVFESIRLYPTNQRVLYPPALFTGQSPPPNALATTSLTYSALTGTIATQQRKPAVMFDPQLVWVPGAVASPCMLQEVVWRALAPNVMVQLRWWSGKTETIPLMTAYGLPGSPGAPLNFSQGLPAEQNRRKFPEGWVWNEQGAAELFSVILQLQTPVVVPFRGVFFPADPSSSQSGPAAARAPTNYGIDVQTRLDGVGFSLTAN